MLALLCLCIAAVPASAADPYEFEPQLSLTADCQAAPLDPVPDPGCPYLPPPDGPSGKFNEPRAIAIDAYGNEYVASTGGEKGRIDVFDDEGFFITEFFANAKNVAVDSAGNLYAFTSNGQIFRYPPSVYKPEAGEIEYKNPPVEVAPSTSLVGALAIDPSNDHLFVTRPSTIIEYTSAADGNKVEETFKPEKLGTWTESIAVDGQRRRLYVGYCKAEFEECGVLVIGADAPHSLLKEIDGSTTPAGKFFSIFGQVSTAVDEELGDFFVEDIAAKKTVYQFDEDFEYLSQVKFSGFQSNNSMQMAVSNGESSPGKDAFNRHFLFVPALPPVNRALAFQPPAVAKPEILAVSSENIGETEAELRATIDPRGADTDYAFEYVTQQHFEAEGFANANIAGEGTIPGTSLETQVSALLTGLTPGTAYRFRVRAENEKGPAEEEGNEGAFATYSDAGSSLLCPNEAARIGASAVLPDCRAYELVTPPDTNGRPPKGLGAVGDLFSTPQASPAGDAVSFVIEGGSLPGTTGTGAFNGDPYRATRGPSGWSSVLAGPSGDEATVSIPGNPSPDQGYSFWIARVEGSLVIEGGETRYVRYPDGHSELIGRGSIGTDPRAVGRLITENGTHIVFQTVNLAPAKAQQLEPNAPPTGTRAVYDRTPDEVTHVVSLLPGDVTPAAGENATYLGASADGEGIAFEIGTTLYLRLNNATTFQIGTGVTFAGVSEGGGRVFYVEGGDLKAFDTATEEVVAFSSTGDVTPVNVAPSGERAYFVSPSVLGGANPNGAVAQAGEENLYLSAEGAISFVGTVTAEDVEGESIASAEVNGLGLWTKVLQERRLSGDSSRLTPDGSVLLFQSRAALDGQATGGEPQIFRYDSVASRLHCLSCIPTGVPEGGGASIQSFAAKSTDPQPLSTYDFVPGLRADGKRAFFESDEALVSYDTDEVRDVYEWEEEGTGSCARAGGCVYLISSGASERDNYLYGHSASGDDVFFTTPDLLTGFDAGGTVSIYDARVGGGFAEPSPSICDGEGCRPALTPAPPVTAPAKPASGGDDNLKPKKPRPCPKGKRKVKRAGKVVCVKKKQRKHKQRRTGANQRGAAR